jgi:hypothetical protein
MTSIDESQSRSSYTDVNCRGTNSTEPPPTNSPLLKQRSSSNFMNTSTCSVYSNASVHPHERLMVQSPIELILILLTNYLFSQRPRSMYNQPSISVIPSKFDSEYANISTVIIRPQSKSSRRTESIETLKGF